jgi:hypothetical protein
VLCQARDIDLTACLIRTRRERDTKKAALDLAVRERDHGDVGSGRSARDRKWEPHS